MNNDIKNIILTPMNILYKFNPKLTLQILFRFKTGYNLNLNNPRTFNEKLQWIKLNYNHELLPICADKYEVRQFIKESGCENILNTLLWEGFQPKDIPFDKLPNKFVIKVTHGQGLNIICTDKCRLDKAKTISKLKRWLHTKYLPCYGEWFYGVIKPRIIIETYLEDGMKKTPLDYKVYCFHGQPKMINAHVDRFTNHKSNLYDLDWKVIDDMQTKYVDSDLYIEKPKELEELIKYAKRLSAKFIHVRVDFYIVNSKIYFGEMTFTDGAGFDKNSRKYDETLGDWMRING